MSNLKIAGENIPSRLYQNDLNHVKRKVKEEGITDTRFKDKSSTIRHYVHLGIITEKRTETANTLDNRIIKASQKEVVTETLLPVKNSIDGLIEVMREFERKQNSYFSEANKKFEILTRRVEGLNDVVNQQFSELFKEFFRTGKISEESLRNVIVLRSIQYVFLLGYKTGRIDPQERTPWEKLIAFAHTKAQELSLHELQHLAEGSLESSVVENLASEMFSTIRELQPKTFHK